MFNLMLWVILFAISFLSEDHSSPEREAIAGANIKNTRKHASRIHRLSDRLVIYLRTGAYLAAKWT